MRKLTIPTNWPRWTKLTIAISAVVLLSSYTPVPGLIHQIKSLGELRVVTRVGPLEFYRGPDGTAEGFFACGKATTNCVFAGETLWVTNAGVLAEGTDPSFGGTLGRVRIPGGGAPTFLGRIGGRSSS